MKLRTLILLLCGLTAFSAIPARAQPSLPTSMAIASDLGIGLDELVACWNDARWRAEGPSGSPERRAAAEALVLSCLQSTRPELTADRFAAVLAAHRPQVAAGG